MKFSKSQKKVFWNFVKSEKNKKREGEREIWQKGGRTQWRERRKSERKCRETDKQDGMWEKVKESDRVKKRKEIKENRRRDKERGRKRWEREREKERVKKRLEEECEIFHRKCFLSIVPGLECIQTKRNEWSSIEKWRPGYKTQTWTRPQENLVKKIWPCGANLLYFPTNRKGSACQQPLTLLHF